MQYKHSFLFVYSVKGKNKKIQALCKNGAPSAMSIPQKTLFGKKEKVRTPPLHTLFR
jgi:hypothetical protein